MNSVGKGSVRATNSGQDGVIYVDGNFAFQIQSDFRNAYEALSEKCKNIAINMDKAEYMDSSGLGMLLVMKKFLDTKNISYEIVGSHGQTLDLLNLTRFDKYFTINGS